MTDRSDLALLVHYRSRAGTDVCFSHGHCNYDCDWTNEDATGQRGRARQRGRISAGGCQRETQFTRGRACQRRRKRSRPGSVRLSAYRAWRLHIDDRRLVCATEAMAAREYHRGASAFAHPCERLRRVRDERRHARPNRYRNRVDRLIDGRATRETDGDRREMSCSSNAKVGDQHPAATC